MTMTGRPTANTLAHVAALACPVPACLLLLKPASLSRVGPAMHQDLQRQFWTVMVCTAALFAVTAADVLRSVQLYGPRVAAFCGGLAAILGFTLYLETIVEQRRRKKVARRMSVPPPMADGEQHRSDGRKEP